MNSRVRSKRIRPLPTCVICGTRRDVEHHHIGGRNHIAWLTAPLCRSHHRQCHRLLDAAGVDLTFCADPLERLFRASGAILVFLCMIRSATDDRYRAKG